MIKRSINIELDAFPGEHINRFIERLCSATIQEYDNTQDILKRPTRNNIVARGKHNAVTVLISVLHDD